MNNRIIKGRLLCIICFMSFLEYSRYNRGDRELVTGSEVIMVIGRIKLFKSFSCVLYPMGLTMSHNENNDTIPENVTCVGGICRGRGESLESRK